MKSPEREEAWGEGVSASLFPVASLPNTFHNKECTFTDFLWVRACFFLRPVHVVFLFQKWHIRCSSPELPAVALSHALQGPKEEKRLQWSI